MKVGLVAKGLKVPIKRRPWTKLTLFLEHFVAKLRSVVNSFFVNFTDVLLSHRQKPGAKKRLSLHQIPCHSVSKIPDDLPRLCHLELTSRLWECSRYNARESTSN